MLILSFVFALMGLFVGGLINVLADDLPARVRPQRPHCPRCGYVYGPIRWLAVGRYIQGGACPNCELPTRRRALRVELSTILVFALLPWLISPVTDLIIYSVYVAVLILIVVIDLEHRLILHVVTFPTTAFALLASFLLTDNTFLSALLGAIVGFLFFYVAYLVGQRLFGPGALGFGDVTMAAMLGAMLGFHRIFFALILAILLGGLWSLVGILSGRISRNTYFAYGPFLAVAGALAIVWGQAVMDWYTGS